MVKDLADAFASPPLSDLEPSSVKSILLRGGRGMMTSSGIYKPSFFSMMFLNLLGETCIHYGDNDIISMDPSGRMIALLFNYSHPGTDPAVDQSRLTFHHLPGKIYQVTRLLSTKNGEAFSTGSTPLKIRLPSPGCENQLRQSIWPHVSIFSEKSTNVLNHSESINPHEMIALILTPRA